MLQLASAASVVPHAFVRFAVGQGPQPGAVNIDQFNFFVERKFSKAAAPLGWNHAGGMVREAGKNQDNMTGTRPVLGEFGGARGGRSHFRGEIL